MPAINARRISRHKAKGPIDPGFGQRLRQLRQQRGLTQAQLAGADFTKAFISHIERGRTRVSMRAAGILASRLAADIGDLLVPTDRSQLQAELALVVAESHLARQNPAAALDSLRERTQDASPQQRARIRRVEGRAELALGKARDAVGHLSEAVRLFRAIPSPEMVTRATYDLAYAHASLDESGEAVGLLMDCERALKTGELTDTTLELQVHSLLAGLFSRMGDNASADLQAERAARLAEDVVDEGALDTLYAGLIGLRREQGDLEGALLYARKALQLHERAGREAEAVHAWNNLAWIYIERGQYVRADDALQKAERLRKERSAGAPGHLLVTRAKLDLARGQPARALALALQAATDDRVQRTSRAQALFIVARALAATGADLADVRAAFERALAAYEEEPARKRARVHEAYAEVLAQMDRPVDAYAELRSALKLTHA